MTSHVRMLIAGCAIISGLVWLFLASGVLFGSSCLLSLILVIVFVSSDGSPLLDAQEDENRFWTAVAMVLSSAVFFAADSPFAVGRWSPMLGVTFVCICGLWISWYDRWLRRRRLSRSYTFSKARSVRGKIDESLQALQKVDDALTRLDNYYIPTTITRRFYGRRETLRLERIIIETLQDAAADELNLLVMRMKLGLLIYKLKDAGRTDLVELLAVQRVADLAVYARVALLAALQQMPLSAHHRGEIWVKNVILWTKGEDLTELKSLADGKGDVHSFHKLLYNDVKTASIRAEILKHIHHEARIQEAHFQLSTRIAREKLAARRGERKVLSDIDDTLECSGGKYPAGIDRRYPRHAIYPGICALYRELDLGCQTHQFAPPSSSSSSTTNENNNMPLSSNKFTEDHDPFESSESKLGRPGNLTFLSARPHVLGDISERTSYLKFKMMFDCRRLHAMPSLLVGDLRSGSETIFTGDFEPLAIKKAKNFIQYASLYPEFRFVFLGDNGQGDVRAAELVAEAFDKADGFNRYKLERVYIHLVQPIENTHHRHPSFTAATHAWKANNIVFVQSYVDAAIDAATCHPPLISPLGLRRVAIAALADLETYTWGGSHHAALSGTPSMTSSGLVLSAAGSYYPFPKRGTAAAAGEKSSHSADPEDPSPTGALDPRLEQRRQELRAAVQRANTVLTDTFNLAPVDLELPQVPQIDSSTIMSEIPENSVIQARNSVSISNDDQRAPKTRRLRFQLPAPGAAVRTPLGGGILLRARHDDICEVALDWRLSNRQPAIGFFAAESIS